LQKSEAIQVLRIRAYITEKSCAKLLCVFFTGWTYAPYAPCTSTPLLLVVCPGYIDIFRNSIWRPPPSSFFTRSEFGTFHHDGCAFLELYTTFGSVASYNRRERPTFCYQRLTDGVMQINCRFLFGHLGTFAWSCRIMYQILCKELHPVRIY